VYQVLVTDVRSEGINGIKVLVLGSTGTLGRGEEVGSKGDDEKLVIETFLENHVNDVSQADTTIAVCL
jgi:hypothetical protein